MKIILNENQVSGILKEEKGVSRVCVTYTNIILNKLSPLINDFIKTKKSEKKKVVITTSELKDAWLTDIDEFIDFPISEIRIDFITVLEKKNPDYTFITSAGAEQIEHKTTKDSYLTKPPKELPNYVKEQLDATLNAKFEFYIYITKEFDESSLNELIYECRDTILHETNHMLEFFKKNEKGLGYVDVSLGTSGEKNYNIPRDIFDIWKKFLLLVYYSEPHEMRAMIQEMYSVRERAPFEIFKEHRYYKAANHMEDFNADKLFDELRQSIEIYNPDSEISILTNLWKWFMDDYFETSKLLKTTPNKRVQNSIHVLQLMKTLQPRINKAGKYLKRKFNTLYSIDID